jgi:ribose 1,5-bisphosphokinase
MSEVDTKPANDRHASRGTMVVVVGPSGAGKDTLMALAAAHFAGSADAHFVRRVITRGADAGGEDHLSVSESDFDAMQRAASFAVWWSAHGLKYGIPASVFDDLSKGRLVIGNGSRSVLDRFETAFSQLTIINITARPEVLAERLQARGRESREDILKRLAREAPVIEGRYDVIDIDNSGALADASRAMIEALEAVMARGTCRSQ